uniref:CCHC-type domain-containing protein n=1 Tax=Nothobranchius furzeri TaxID=105023 RepID=A0A8C6KWV7_NOTFU
VPLLRNKWCRGEGLEEAKALLVLVPEEVEIAQIEETMETIKCLGRVRVRGRLFHTPLSCLMVLCECKQSIPKDNVPKEVLDPHTGEKWPIVTLNECAAPDDFAVKLKSLLDTEGRTIEDLQRLFISPAPPQPSSDPSINSTESVLQAVGDFLEKARKPQAEGGYRRLRLFSGNLPVPLSEDPFDHWLEQAWLMVEESDCTDKERRRRLMESLKGPALEIAKSVRESDPEAGPVEYLEALESAFGSAESGDDLYFAFRLMQQQPSEKLSDFLRRLERALTKVVQRGGFQGSSKDKARLEQLLRGAVASDLMLINLRLRERKSKPPTFLQLLSEIRTEEEYEASRRKDTAPDSSLKLATVAAVEANSKTRTPYQNRTPLGEQFCYRCGENGHFVAKCQNPENQSKVIRKLIQTVKTLKESAATSTRNATDTDCHVKQGLLT